MKVTRILAADQISQLAQDLAINNKTTKSICGYIVCGLCQFLAEQDHVTEETLRQINIQMLAPYIERAMQSIAKNRRMEIKKFMNRMNENDKKSYMTDWVAAFEIVDYLESISDGIINHQLFFFRQCGYDHPQAMEKVKFEEAERIKQQQIFKGQLYFYSSFNPYQNKAKQYFAEEIKKSNFSKLPIIVATDVMGHFNTTILLQGRVYVLDSLPYVQGQYDNAILQAICYYYQQSYLKQ